VFSIALNIYRNEVRRRNTDKRRGREIPFPETGSDSRPASDRGPQTVASAPLPDTVTMNREHLRAVQICLEAMPSQMRRCVKLRIWGHGIQQIARLLDRTPNTVKVHLHRARKRLQEELGQHFDEAGF
jgi:RNA polymerase sigma-70 factor (ECF subfamily)